MEEYPLEIIFKLSAIPLRTHHPLYASWYEQILNNFDDVTEKISTSIPVELYSSVNRRLIITQKYIRGQGTSTSAGFIGVQFSERILNSFSVFTFRSRISTIQMTLLWMENLAVARTQQILNGNSYKRQEVNNQESIQI